MKPELTKEDSETYLKIVLLGDMDAMFDFGYLMGESDRIRMVLDLVSKVDE